LIQLTEIREDTNYTRYPITFLDQDHGNDHSKRKKSQPEKAGILLSGFFRGSRSGLLSLILFLFFLTLFFIFWTFITHEITLLSSCNDDPNRQYGNADRFGLKSLQLPAYHEQPAVFSWNILRILSAVCIE
jgi:hypothetical protein